MVRGNMLGDEISEFFSEWLYLLKILSYLFSSNNSASNGDEIEVEGYSLSRYLMLSFM